MRIMEEKGYIKHFKQGIKYVYSSVMTPKKACETELLRLVKTYFNNSTQDAFAALLNIDKKNLKIEDFDRLKKLIEEAKDTNN